LAGSARWLFVTIARGLAFFVAAYASLSLVALALSSSYNANAWWIDLSFMPSFLNLVSQLVLIAVLYVFAFWAGIRPWMRRAAAVVCVLFACFALSNMLGVYNAAEAGDVRLGFPVPFSFFIMCMFAFIAAAMLVGVSSSSRNSRLRPGAGHAIHGQHSRDSGATSPADEQHAFSQWELPPRSRARRGWKTVLVMALTVIVVGILFPLGQVFCFGMTDYRTRVDAAVVLGAHVMPNGMPTLALRDRLDAAIGLYEEGLVPVLIMSGGIDVDGVSEGLAMRDYAVAQGVPAAAILVDEYGSNTELTARNTVRICKEQGFERVAAVSTFYHMARIKMLYLSEGFDVRTVPAPFDPQDSSILLTTLREVPGWWYYWFANVVV